MGSVTSSNGDEHAAHKEEWLDWLRKAAAFYEAEAERAATQAEMLAGIIDALEQLSPSAIPIARPMLEAVSSAAMEDMLARHPES